MGLRPATSALIVFLSLQGGADAANVYVLRSGDAQSDQAVQSTLQERGHTVTMGPVSVDFTGNQANLGSFDVTVVLYPAIFQTMQNAGTAALRSYLINGGRLITGEWFNESFGDGSDLRRLLPITRASGASTGGQTTFAKDEPDALLDDGVSDTFTFDVGATAGFTASADAKTYFSSRRTSGPGLVGRVLAGGARVLCFSTAFTSSGLQNPDFRRLLGNAVNWAIVPYAPPAPNPAESARVYLLRSGDADTDREVQRVLTERGHSVTTGPVSIDFAGSQANLASFDVTLLLYPANFSTMQAAGTAALRSYLLNGGRLITGEWFNESFGDSSDLRSLLPVTRASGASTGAQTTFAKAEPDGLIDDGVSDTFTFDLDVTAGFTTSADAKTYFASRRTSAPGLVGRVLAGGGKVLSFSTSIGALEVQNPDFRRLLGNAINWAKPAPTGFVSVAPNTLSFSFTTGGTAPPAQTLSLSSSGGSIGYTTTASTTLGGKWLAVTPASGTAPAVLSVTVDPTGLMPGTYTGDVAIVSNPTLHVPITLVVVPPGSGCTYTVSPLSVNLLVGGGPGDIGVSTQTGCTWTAASNAPWITVSSGLSGVGAGTVHYTVAPNPGAQSRQGTLTVAGQQFSINQTGSALSFIVGPSPLSFRFTQGATAPAEHALYINPSVPGASFTMTATGGAWLSATPSSGTVPGAVVVTVNPSGLAAGTYTGNITVRIPNATPPDQIVPVAVIIESTGQPQLGVDSSTINATATKGGHADVRKLQVRNLGSGTLLFRTTTSGGAWLSVQPDSGSASVAAPATVVVTADPQGLEAGTYTGRVLITPASGAPVGIDVFFTVSAADRTMLLSQSGLTFTAVVQGGAVPAQNFGILNTAEGVMDWSAAPSTLAGGPWLSVSPNRGSSDAASLDVPLADVNINAAGLAPGEYHGLITVTSSTAANSPQLVSVLLRVLPPGSDPGPVVRPTGLIFTAAAGSGAAGTQEVLVSNLAASPRNFTSSPLTYDGALWFTHLPVASTVTPAQPTHLLVQANLASLSPGVRRGVLTLLFADGAVQNVSILSLVASPPVTALARGAVSAASTCGTPALQVQPTSIRSDYVAVVGQATTIAVKVADECGRLLDKSGLVTVRFSTNEPSIRLANIGGGNWTGTWRPVRAAGSVAIEISAFLFDLSVTRAGQAVLSGSVADTSQLPVVTAGGIQQAASFVKGLPLAPGSLVTLFGSNLADGESTADGLPLPSELNHVQVVLGDRSLPLLYTSSGQVNVQVPYSLPVNTQHQIAIRRGNVLSVPETLSVAAAQPGIFTVDQNGSGQGVIFKSDEVTLAAPASPAAAGETVIVYCTGLGAVDPAVSEGVAAPSPSAKTMNPVTLRIGGVEAQVVFSGLVPEKVGLYRVEAVVPQVTAGDAVPVQIEVAGQISPPVTMAIR